MADQPRRLIDYRVDDRVVRLKLDRPPLNVLNLEMLRELDEALTRAPSEPGVCAVLLEAAGKAFCAGVDVAEHAPEVVGEMIPLFDGVCRRLAEMPVITVAQIQGAALGGGCELVACCDFAWMVSGAQIGQPEIQLGVFPPVAALILPGLVGPRWAGRLVLTGEVLDGERASHIGLVTAAAEPSDLVGEVEAFLNRLRGLSAAALGHTLRAHRIGLGARAAQLDEIEAIYLQGLMKTDDAAEGLAAFLEKRKPVWKHA